MDETDFTLVVQLNKSSCTVFYTVMLYSTAQPSLASVLAGTAPGSLYNGTIPAGTVRVSHNVASCADVQMGLLLLCLLGDQEVMCKKQHDIVFMSHAMSKLSQHHLTILLLYSSPAVQTLPLAAPPHACHF